MQMNHARPDFDFVNFETERLKVERLDVYLDHTMKRCIDLIKMTCPSITDSEMQEWKAKSKFRIM